MTVSAGHRIERKPSMEAEPRTLSLAELRSAREEVMFILNTKTLEEAINIFTEGLEPAVRGRRDVNMNMNVEEDEEDDDDEEEEMMMQHSLSDDYMSNIPDGVRRHLVTAFF